MEGLLTLMVVALSAATVASYSNYTVGGDAGWFFKSTTNTSVANYQTWAKSITFGLGDFLIFKTSSNQTVVQTYNETTFKNCDYSDSGDDSTKYTVDYHFDVTGEIAIPLTQTGANYYFSDADDGIQCVKGLAFSISVQEGQGLPPSLRKSPPSPPATETPPAADTPPIGTPSSQNEAYAKSAAPRLIPAARFAFQVMVVLYLLSLCLF